MIRGIGPVYAKKFLRAFGVFDVIEAEPDRLREVGGMATIRFRTRQPPWSKNWSEVQFPVRAREFPVRQK